MEMKALSDDLENIRGRMSLFIDNSQGGGWRGDEPGR